MLLVINKNLTLNIKVKKNMLLFLKTSFQFIFLNEIFFDFL